MCKPPDPSDTVSCAGNFSPLFSGRELLKYIMLNTAHNNDPGGPRLARLNEKWVWHILFHQAVKLGCLTQNKGTDQSKIMRFICIFLDREHLQRRKQIRLYEDKKGNEAPNTSTQIPSEDLQEIATLWKLGISCARGRKETVLNLEWKFWIAVRGIWEYRAIVWEWVWPLSEPWIKTAKTETVQS